MGTFCFVQGEELERQQEEQLALLQELEEKRRSLEHQLEEAQLCRQRLQDALQVPSETCSLQETPTPQEETVFEPSPEVRFRAAVKGLKGCRFRCGVHIVNVCVPYF